MVELFRVFLLIVGFSSGLTNGEEPSEFNLCKLPPNPHNGSFEVNVLTDSEPGESSSGFFVYVTCDSGYDLVGEGRLSCLGGWLSDQVPVCVPHSEDGELRVVRRHLVVWNQRHPDANLRISPASDPVKFRSNQINCGVPIPAFAGYVIGGRVSEPNEMPWHAAIFKKTITPYMQICGGTLVSKSVVISAAHCFWSDVSKEQPAKNYAVAVGKLYRPWNDPKDEQAQKSNIKAIKIPPRFQGSATNFQDDVAVVIVETPFNIDGRIRPICLDFEHELDDKQLSVGQYGKVAGWGLSTEDGGASPVLKVVELPFVAVEKCLAEAPIAFKPYITSDKICAGYTNGTAVCRGDSGGGLALAEDTNGWTRYYLRGVVSTAPRNDHLCNAYDRTTFTQIVKHEQFIRKYLI